MNIGEQQSFFSDEQKQQEEDRKKILEKQKKLTKTLAYHAHNYYDLDTPTIADREYDALYDELVLLEKKTGVIFDNSPTQRVGGGILTEFKKYPHRFRLYSLDKCQTRSELEKWVADVKELVPDATFTCEYKFDGLSLVCHYKNGELI